VGQVSETGIDLELEERAHALRMAMLRDKEFIAGIQAGYEQAQRGEGLTLAELKERLGWE
jgi:predicted transcriptional regulator